MYDKLTTNIFKTFNLLTLITNHVIFRLQPTELEGCLLHTSLHNALEVEAASDMKLVAYRRGKLSGTISRDEVDNRCSIINPICTSQTS